MASDTKQNDAVEKKPRKSTGVREEIRRGQRVLVIDFRYRIPDGSPKGKSARYRHDAEVQTWQGARAEYRRRREVQRGALAHGASGHPKRWML